MAVFTQVDPAPLSAWLAQRRCGTLVSHEGISSGIENTNYFVNTTEGRFVLTLFEKLTARELPYYLGLMQHLAQAGLPVPGPEPDQDGHLFSELCGKPAALVACLPGRSVDLPNAAQCSQIGQFAAQAHRAVHNFHPVFENPRGLAWWQSTQDEVSAFLPHELRALLASEVQAHSDFAQTDTYKALPKGAVHADLFRDNALMIGDTLGGVIDFYFAGDDTFLFDLAVCVNDWCIDLDTGALDPARTRAMLDSYAHTRPFSEHERAAWPMALRAAALRFWISRLYDYYMPRPAAMLKPKDPSHFERILKARQVSHIPLSSS